MSDTNPTAAWPGLMNRPQAAAYWSMSERTFASLVAAGIISGRKIGPRMIRYSKADLDAASEKFPTGKGNRPSE
ncbi:helix-turn-helix domain-containing protein [Rhodopirellula bahusiensis]|uniref:Helix-turn-helix domain-containing protein n=1 Tax=Rhodopirellula bahusiensis TaxID=2014065 RepID=A0A2G1W6E2_9BACT|nr:helix-turn-helix domain-containing protein [Rhodopirellula bahusiensis]PHQ34597.1 hypothetical protein CEE69_14380 [Rhodopirellula bahusiensis]